MEFHSLHDVLIEQVQDLYSAEQQLVEALPKVANAANSDELRQTIETHLGETRGHLQRLRELLPTLGAGAPTEQCEGMAGLLREGEKVIAATGDPAAKDAALIAAAQRVEHYEIAGYGTAATLAGNLDLNEAKDILDQTLDEETHADKLLTKVATGGMFRTGVNQAATR
jgi:ferritin-like metal-binding protein YciE